MRERVLNLFFFEHDLSLRLRGNLVNDCVVLQVVNGSVELFLRLALPEVHYFIRNFTILYFPIVVCCSRSKVCTAINNELIFFYNFSVRISCLVTLNQNLNKLAQLRRDSRATRHIYACYFLQDFKRSIHICNLVSLSINMATHEIDNSKMTCISVKFSFLMYSEECLLPTLSGNTHLLNYKILGELDCSSLYSIAPNSVILVLNTTVLVYSLLIIACQLEPFKLGKELQRL